MDRAHRAPRAVLKLGESQFADLEREPEFLKPAQRSAFLDPSADGSKNLGPVRKVPDSGGVSLALAAAKKNPDSGDSISDSGKIL